VSGRRRIGLAAPLAGAGALLLVLPMVALVWRAPWSEATAILRDDDVRTALRLSLVASLSATAVAGAIGFPLAWILARRTFRGRRLLRALALVPLVLPPVVGGVALLLAFGRRGIVGQLLDDWFGIRLPFTLAGAVIAEAFVALPFLVLTAEAAFRNLDSRFEDAARTLGARPTRLVWRVVVPLTWPSLLAGVVLAWARALGEFGATITFAGNAPGRTSTVPLEVYVLLESGRLDAAIIVSVVLLGVSIAALVGLRERWLAGL
jgi:molybdate transport system permease protein